MDEHLNNKHLLVLGTWDMREAALATWADAEIEVTLVDGAASSCRGPASRRVDLDVWDSSRPDRRALAELASTADGVVTLDEFSTATAARVAQDAGLPGPGVSAALLARDRIALRRYLAAAGVPGPRFAEVRDHRDVDSFFAAADGIAAVLKPADSGGSGAVVPVGSPAEALAALPRILRWSFSGRAILEEPVAGRAFSVEAIVQHGIPCIAAIIEKATLPRGLIETRHVVPPDLSPEQSSALELAAAGVIDALAVENAIVHVEFRLGEAGFIPIDVALRPAGGLIPDLLRLASGIDLYRAQASLAVSAPLEPPLGVVAGCAGVQVVTATGPVTNGAPIGALERDHPGVVRAGALVRAGTELSALGSGGVRAGFVIARAASAGALHRVLDAATEDLAARMGLTPDHLPMPRAA